MSGRTSNPSVQLGGQAAYLFVGNVFTLLVGLPLQIFVARNLGVKDLGAFSILEGIMSMVAGLFAFGIAPTLIKFIPSHLERGEYAAIRGLIRLGAVILIFGGAIAYGIALLTTPVLLRLWPELVGHSDAVMTMGLLIPLSLIGFFLQQSLRGFQDIRYIVMGSSIMQLTIKTFMAVLLLIMGFHLLGYVCAVIISLAAGVAWMALGLRRWLALLPDRAARDYAHRKAWWNYAKIMYGNSLLGMGGAYLDRFLLGAFAGVGPVGVLAVVKQLQLMPLVFLNMFLAAASPMFSAAHARNDGSELQYIYHLTTDWVVRLSGPLFLFFFIFAHPVLHLFGARFADEGVYPLWIILVGQLINIATGPVGNLVWVAGMEPQALRLSAIQAALTVVGLLVTVPLWGLTGAAAAYSAGVIFINVAEYRVARSQINLRWMDRRYLGWVVPAASACMVGLLVKIYGPAEEGPVLLAAYLLLLYGVFHGVAMLQGLNEDDRELFAHLLDRLVLVKSSTAAVTKKLLPIRWRMRIADLRGFGVYSDHADKYKCIFIHIPKAAGSSVARALFDRGSRHVAWQAYYQTNPAKYRQYFKFAFVRNPWDRIVSAYFFLKEGGASQADAEWASANISSFPDFGSFVRGWLNEKNIQTWVHFRHQHEFICSTDGKVMVDFVGRFENIDADFAQIANRLGCTRRLGRVNGSGHRHYSSYYDEETSEIVRSLYARDIEIFRYEFERKSPFL